MVVKIKTINKRLKLMKIQNLIKIHKQVNDDKSVSANESRKRKFETENVSNTPNKTLTPSKSKMLKKEIDLYTDTLKSFKLKLRITKKTDFFWIQEDS